MVDSIGISATEFPGLSLVATSKDIHNKPLINFCGTSAATPKASKMLSRIWAENPEYSAATIRGLLIHSANWTGAMKEQFENRYNLFRTCGYGVPDVQSAIKSANSHVTLIAEDEITCNYEEGQSEERYLNYYEIPWPKDLLLTLGEKEVE
ncbi:S8 family serine peptidase [Halanaerobaculum tunisiense]